MQEMSQADSLSDQASCDAVQVVAASITEVSCPGCGPLLRLLLFHLGHTTDVLKLSKIPSNYRYVRLIIMEGGSFHQHSPFSPEVEPSPTSKSRDLAILDADDEVDFLFDEIDCSSPGNISSTSSDAEDAPTALDVDNPWNDIGAQGLPAETEGALTAALRSQSLTPLLKEELRCKIQLKRLLHGKEELSPDFTPKTSSMSMEEVVKKNKKMELNRQSAQRSRNRRKSVEKNIQSKIDDMEKQNALLAEQAKCLRHACHVAKEWLQQHRACLKNTFDSSASVGASLLPTGESYRTSDRSDGQSSLVLPQNSAGLQLIVPYAAVVAGSSWGLPRTPGGAAVGCAEPGLGCGGTLDSVSTLGSVMPSDK